ncbi:hypothetical protein [Dactylosporangium sp. CA-139066]|uniref:hypothetical protein n=1 Tax=Dactylosporangium sp. CA-139066 TaxID=3239930 RepID=UPI003D8EA1A5
MTLTEPPAESTALLDATRNGGSASPAPRSRRLVPLLAALVVLVLAGVGVGAGAVVPREPDTAQMRYPAVTFPSAAVAAPCTSGGGPPPEVPAVGGDAAAWLRAAAAGLGPADADTTTGRYAHIRRHAWYGDMGPGADGLGHTELRVQTVEGWYAEDGTGATITTTYPRGSTQPASGAAGAKVEREVAAAGHEHYHHLYFPGLPSSDPQQLAGQLHRMQPPQVGEQALIRAVARLVEEYTLPCPVRSAVLQVLATSRVVWRGPVTDRAGRPAVAVSVDSADGVERDTLLLDPGTGVVRGYEELVLRNPGKLAGPFPLLFEALVYLTTDWQDAIGPAATS